MACILSDPDRRWDGPIIPYVIDANLTNPQRFLEAVAVWESVAGVRFVVHDAQDDFIYIRHGQNACHSDTGRVGGQQFVTLLPSCSVAAIVHELGHTLGLKHEHQRPDRDNFVDVHLENVVPGKEHDFVKLDSADVIVTDSYDFQSIMHYSATDFSIDPADPMKHTIDGKAGELLDGSSTPTVLDVQLVNESYNSWVGVVRRSDSGFEAAGEADEIAVASVLPNVVVSAVRTGAGTLKLIVWTVDAAGGISRVADSGDLAGEASSIAIAAGQLLVTAMRDGSGNLFLVSWLRDPVTNGLTRSGSSGAQSLEADVINLVAVTPTLFLTACRAGNGRLLLISWNLDTSGNLSRTPDGEAGLGVVSEISTIFVASRITDADESVALVATTVRTDDGNAQVIIWQVGLADGSIEKRGDSGSLIGEATKIATTLDQHGHVVVSCRNGSGILELITMSVSADGLAVERLADSGKDAGDIGLNAVSPGPGGVVSAISTAPSGAKLKLINWHTDVTGVITRAGDSSDQAGQVGTIVFGATAQAEAPLLTAVKRADGNLALISWSADSVHGEI